MSRAAFEALVRALGDEVGHALDPSQGAVVVQLNRVGFSLLHDAGRYGQDQLVLSCDFGAVPSERRAEILERVLELNADVHGTWSPVFCILPGTGCLMAVSALPMAALDGLALVDLMMRHLLIVERWQATRFLDVTGTSPASAPAPS